MAETELAGRSETAPHCPSCRCSEGFIIPHGYEYDEEERQGSARFEDSIDSLEDRIEHLVARLYELRRQRNALTPINRLPPEILLNIFLHFRAISWYTHPRWVEISHICSMWRNIALSSSVLWNTLDLRYPKLTKELIRRSRGVPVHVHRASTAILGLPFLDPSIPIASIDVAVYCAHIPAVLGVPFGQLSQLKELEVTMLEFPFRGPYLHNELTQQYPCLQVIRLHRCHLDWTSPLLNTPTHLRVIEITDSPSYMFLQDLYHRPFRHVLTVLSHQQKLEYLELDRALPFLNPSNLGNIPAQRVSLPNLRYLRIHDNASEMLFLFSRLRLPPGCTVVLNIAEESGDNAADRFVPSIDLLSFTESVLAHARDYRESSLMISWAGSLTLVCVDGHRVGDQTPPRIECSWPIPRDEDPRAYTAVLGPSIGALSVSKIRITVGPVRTRLEHEHWRQLFGNLNNVSTLRVSMNYNNLLGTLRALADFDADTPRMLPHMHTLEIAALRSVTLASQSDQRAAVEEIAHHLEHRSTDGVFERLYICEDVRESTEWIRVRMEGVASMVVWGADLRKWM